jgi:hypothetical protein
LFILFRRAYGNSRQISLLILCIITLLSNIFLAIASRSDIEPKLLHVSFIADFIFTMILLWNCTKLPVLRHSILASLIIFTAVFTGFHLYHSAFEGLPNLNIIGTTLIFLVASSVLFSIASRVDRNILSAPDFWYSGGIFIHFGLLSLILITEKKITDVDYHNKDQYNTIYGIIFSLQFLFFCIGVYAHQPWMKRRGLF